MLFAPPTPLSAKAVEDLTHYSRTLHDYTLRLWTESRRLAEEKVHTAHRTRRAQPRYVPYDAGSDESSDNDRDADGADDDALTFSTRRGSDSSTASRSSNESTASASDAQQDASELPSHHRSRAAGDDTPEREHSRKRSRAESSSADLGNRLAAVAL